MFDEPGETLIFTSDGDATQPRPRCEPQASQVAAVAAMPHGRLDLDGRVAASSAERECNDVLVEAGPDAVRSFLAAGLVDELIVYLAPSCWATQARADRSTAAAAAIALERAPRFDYGDCSASATSPT